MWNDIHSFAFPDNDYSNFNDNNVFGKWTNDEFGTPDVTALKIEAETATDKDKDEFISILLTGNAPAELKSRYSDFKARASDYFSFPADKDSGKLYTPSNRGRVTRYCIMHFLNP